MKNCRTCKWEPEEWDQEAPDWPEVGYCRAPIPFCVTEALIYYDGKGADVPFLVSWCIRSGVTILNAYEAFPQKNARYIGLTIEKMKGYK